MLVKTWRVMYRIKHIAMGWIELEDNMTEEGAEQLIEKLKAKPNNKDKRYLAQWTMSEEEDGKMFLDVTMRYLLNDGTYTDQSYLVVGTKNRLDLAREEADEHIRGDLKFYNEDMHIVSGRVKQIRRVG